MPCENKALHKHKKIYEVRPCLPHKTLDPDSFESEHLSRVTNKHRVLMLVLIIMSTFAFTCHKIIMLADACACACVASENQALISQCKYWVWCYRLDFEKINFVQNKRRVIIIAYVISFSIKPAGKKTYFPLSPIMCCITKPNGWLST